MFKLSPGPGLLYDGLTKESEADWPGQSPSTSHGNETNQSQAGPDFEPENGGAYTEFEIITKGGTKISGSVIPNNPVTLFAGDDLAAVTITIPKEGNEGLTVLSSD